jgi:Protein of Unknown function (DUF2784)
MRRMLYHLLANAVAVVHLAFIAFVIAGGLLLLRWPRVLWLHLPAAVWGVVIELMGWYCPLTGLENWALRRAGLQGYTEGFVAHYIFALIYPNGLTRGLELLIGAVVLVVNVSVYVRVFK